MYKGIACESVIVFFAIEESNSLFDNHLPKDNQYYLPCLPKKVINLKIKPITPHQTQDSQDFNIIPK
jgi:hypothetical protein